MRVVVVGAGLGGLSAAAHLIGAGHEVTVVEREPVPGGLRIGVVGGGCSGFSYSMQFENGAGMMDKSWDQDGLKLFVDATSAMYLQGCTVDYVETLEARDLVAALRDAQSAMDAAEARVAAARAAVLALVGDADGVTVGGRPVATHHAQSARRVSADRVRDLADQRPDLAPLLDRCFTESTSRVLRLPQE